MPQYLKPERIKISPETKLEIGQKFECTTSRHQMEGYKKDGDKYVRSIGLMVGKGVQMEILEIDTDNPDYIKTAICSKHPNPTYQWIKKSELADGWLEERRSGNPLSRKRAAEILDPDFEMRRVASEHKTREVILEALSLVKGDSKKED